MLIKKNLITLLLLLSVYEVSAEVVTQSLSSTKVSKWDGNSQFQFYKVSENFLKVGALEFGTYIGSTYSSKLALVPSSPGTYPRGSLSGFSTAVYNGAPSSNVVHFSGISLASFDEGLLSATFTESQQFFTPNGITIQSNFFPSEDRRYTAITRNDITHSFDVDIDSWAYKAADFFSDLKQVTLSSAVKAIVIDTINSNHANEINGRKVFVRPKTGGVLGVRGSISTNGTSIFTASPGNLAYDIEFGNDDTLTLPFAFGENKDGSTLEIFFNDNLLGSVFGSDYELDELSFIDVDISGYLGMSGTLNFVLNTTGAESANVYIPESLSSSVVPVPAAVWLFGSGLLGLIGLARRQP